MAARTVQNWKKGATALPEKGYSQAPGPHGRAMQSRSQDLSLGATWGLLTP